MTEIWKPVCGYEGLYEVSNFGKVRSLDRYVDKIGRRSGEPFKALHPGRLIKIQISNGYKSVSLNALGKQTSRTVHTLVLEAFVGSRPMKGFHGCHLDGDKENNRVENLIWGSPALNTSHRLSHGTLLSGSRSPKAKLHENDVLRIREALLFGASVSDLVTIYPVGAAAIRDIREGRNWNHMKHSLAPSASAAGR